jgi:PadR family transcriptional regulator, regulatory protein PadR
MREVSCIGGNLDARQLSLSSCRCIVTPIDILYERSLNSWRHSTGAWRVDRNQANLLQGTLDLLILKAIGDGEFHGLAIARRVEAITGGTFKVRPGSLFPALHGMEEAGWLKSFWGEPENNRRAKYYRRTNAGERQFGVETEQWTTISCAIGRALKTA